MPMYIPHSSATADRRGVIQLLDVATLFTSPQKALNRVIKSPASLHNILYLVTF